MTLKNQKFKSLKKLQKLEKIKVHFIQCKGASLFADKKDLQVGDIIQININEGLKSDSKNKRELTSNRNNALGGGILAGTNGNVLGETAAKYANKVNRNLGVNFNTTSSTSDKGEVKTQFDETFSTTVSAYNRRNIPKW